MPLSVFLREFSEYLETLILAKEPIAIAGDFNIHVDVVDDPETVKLLDLLDCHGLRQHVHEPTHVDGHTLDPIMTRCADHTITTPPTSDEFISDHASVMCHLFAVVTPASMKVITHRKYKSIDVEALKSDLKETALHMDCAHNVCSCPNEVEKLANEYNTTLSKLIDKHAPRKTKTVRTRTSTPWYSAEICAAGKLKRKLERKWRKTGLPEDFKAFKAQRNHVTYMMNEARRIFYTDFIAENSADQGKLFKAAKKLLAKKEVLHFPEYCDNTVIANEIGRFFTRKIDLTRSEIDANGPMNSEDQVMNNNTDSSEDMGLSSFQLLTENDMRDIIQRSARKFFEFDPMPTSLVLSCLDELLRVITRMVNSSLACGYFPSDWKEALVNPLLKKDDLPHVFANLRPVSNLQFVSKLTERAVFNQVQRHMTEYSLYPVLQSAYRKGHSTETALLKVTNDILMNMDRQHVTLLVMLDLSAAFDTVDHEILLTGSIRVLASKDQRTGVKIVCLIPNQQITARFLRSGTVRKVRAIVQCASRFLFRLFIIHHLRE